MGEILGRARHLALDEERAPEEGERANQGGGIGLFWITKPSWEGPEASPKPLEWALAKEEAARWITEDGGRRVQDWPRPFGATNGPQMDGPPLSSKAAGGERAVATVGLSRSTDRPPEIHHRLIEVPRTVNGEERLGQRADPVKNCWAVDLLWQIKETREDPGDIPVDDCRGLAEGDAGDGQMVVQLALDQHLRQLAPALQRALGPRVAGQVG
jgi:hypothetical protein